MRASKRAELVQIVDEVVRPLLDGRMQGQHLERDAQTRKILDAIGEVQPASVDMTQEMADDIVRKIHGPLTIGKEFSQWVAEQGKYHDAFYTFQIGYGADAGRGEMRLTSVGTMQLHLRDQNGALLWQGTFVPPDFGVKDVL